MVTRQSPAIDQFRDQLIAKFDAPYTDGEKTAWIMNIEQRRHVSGRPHCIRTLRGFITHLQKYTDVWWPKREEIADWYYENHERHFQTNLNTR